MSALNATIEKLKTGLIKATGTFRTRIGLTNERLEFVMDSFYKLNPSQRTGLMVGGGIGIGFIVLMLFMLYKSGIDGLERDLNRRFEALYEIQTNKALFQAEEKRFNKLIETVNRKTQDVKIKPLLEKVAKASDVQIQGIQEQKTPLQSGNPLADQMQEVSAELRLPNISIPRLLNLLIEIEKAGGFVKIQDLTIRGRYKDKLYFDAQAKIRSYSTGGE